MSWKIRSLFAFLIFTVISCSSNLLNTKLRVVYMFDDNNISDYEIAFNLFEEFEEKCNIKLSATTYVIVNSIGSDSSRCNLIQLHEMKNKGWEIGSHTITHPLMIFLTEDELRYELEKSKDSLISLGFNVDNFAFPCGVCNEKIRKIAGEYYTFVRDTDDRNWKIPLDRLRIGCYIVPSVNSVSLFRKRLDHALLREEDFLFLLFHKIGYGPKDVRPEDFREITKVLIEEYKLYPMSFRNAVEINRE